MKIKIPFTLTVLLLTVSLSAQPQGERPAPPKMKSPAEMAKMQADRMQTDLSLDKKQYKKVYKLLKKDFEYRQQAHQDNFPGGMPPQGGGPGNGGPGMGGGMMGGGPGMGGGMMGGGPGMGGGMMGGGPGMGGGMPPQQGGMQPGERPEGGPGMGPNNDVTEEYLEKQDKKLKKILTSEQYEKWRSMHPAEHLELPPLEMK